MKNMIKFILLVIVLFLVSYVQVVMVIYVGNVFIGIDDKFIGLVLLIIENDIISEICKGYIKVVKGDMFIDFFELVILLGLMDMYVYLSFQ